MNEMKNKIIVIFCVMLLAMSVITFAFVNSKDINTDGLDLVKNEMSVSQNEGVVNNEQVFDDSINDDVPSFSSILQKESVEKNKGEVFDDFIYDVGPRFSPIKKTDLDKAKFMSDFLSKEENESIVSYKSVDVILIKNDIETYRREKGTRNMLTAAQLNLLQFSEYSTNFKIIADFEQRNPETGKLENNYTSPHLTIVPEKQAEYEQGKDVLKKYLKDNSKESREHIDTDKLQPAKLYFIVTKTGEISNIRLDRTSNFPDLDKKMIELISHLSGKWKPAQNSAGENVDQELVVSFGLMGC